VAPDRMRHAHTTSKAACILLPAVLCIELCFARLAGLQVTFCHYDPLMRVVKLRTVPYLTWRVRIRP
jgi:hypothetical protein